MINWTLVTVVGMICGIVCALVAQRKNLNSTGWFFGGLVLGVFALIAVALMKANPPEAPDGMIAVRCLRCNAEQNVPAGEPHYDCWQCHTVNAAPGFEDVPLPGKD